MGKDNTSAVVFGKMKEALDTVKGDIAGLNKRVGMLEEQPAGVISSSPSVVSNSLYSTVYKALKDVLTERDKSREKEYNGFANAIVQREDEWIKRATAIVEEYKKSLKREEDIDNRLTNIETSIKTGKPTGNGDNSIIEITPFQHMQLTFKSFFQKSFMLDPRVIILNSFLVLLVCAVANMGMKLSALQDTKQKYEIMRHFYRKHEVISSNFMFLDTLFLDKDKNEKVIERLKK